MAGVFASMAVKWALDKLASFLPAAASSSSTTVTTASQDLELLRRLERTMLRIHATLHDAEEHWNIREESAKLRLKELKELAYAAEDVVEEYDNEVDRCDELQATAATSVSNGKRKRQEENKTYVNGAGMVAVPLELVVQARKIIERIDEIKEYSDNFNLSENDGERRSDPGNSTMRMTSSVVCEKSILGREEDKDKVVEILLSIEDTNMTCPVSIMAIVGMGGVGKTTLSQIVYNDRRVRQSFDMFTWVCVSEQFDVSTITKNIISSITKTSCDLSELNGLQEELVAITKGKKVLLVLDDVWNEQRDMWESLCRPLSRTSICNVIVTTRNEAVARVVQTMPVYRINCLSPEESWLLFKQGSLVVHQDNDTPRNLVEIGKSIAEKCKGLPLAIKALGSILRCETDEMRWRDVLESKLWDLEESWSEVLPALELSYKHMPIYLKRCFVALSLFPKDYELSESLVVKLWKSLDLLQSDKNGKEDDNGRIYFNELVQRSLLEVYIEEGDTYVMHDLIHDLACFRGAEEFFRIEGDTSKEIPLTVRYISTTEHGALVKSLTVSHSIRAIIFLDRDKLQVELPLNCKKLRVVAHCLDDEYILDRKDDEYILDGKDDGYSMHFPRGIGCASNLHTLPAMEISRCGCFCNISRLRSLNKIRKLSLSGLSKVACMEDAKGAQLQRKKHLRSLALDFDSNMYHHCKNTLERGEADVTVSHQQLLESLRPHHVLRKLEINSYKSQRYPSWLGNASFTNLTEVSLGWCSSQHLPALGELPSLKSLKVHSMKEVVKIGREFCSHIPGVKGFPSLTDLKFNRLPKLSEWSKIEFGDFPCLQTLEISCAEKLGSLREAPFMSLVTLCLENCGNLTTFPESATLRKLVIRTCGSLHLFPTLVSLQELDIARCPSLHQLPTLVSLWKLYISRCESFQQLPTLVSLRELLIWKCGSLHQLPTLVALRELRISECGSLHQLPTLVSLWTLKIADCPKLSAVGSLPSLTTLVIMIIRHPFDDEEILYKLLNSHSSLECISVKCDTTTCIPLQPQSLPSLTKLYLSCRNLQYCDGLAGLTSLQELDVSGCPNLRNLQIAETIPEDSGDSLYSS